MRIKGMSLTMRPSNGDVFSIKGVNYFQKQGDTQPLLLTPFSLEPGAEWSHITSFYNFLPRQEDKVLREAIAALRSDIIGKLEERGEDAPKTPAHAEQHLVEPFYRMFDRNFKWSPDDYTLTIAVETDPPRAFSGLEFRFVLFESDTKEMRVIRDKYHLGDGVYYANQDTVRGVYVSIQ